MPVHQASLEFRTRGRGTLELTDEVNAIVRAARIARGLATVFVHHTSASLIVCENADPTVRADLERWLARAVPDGDPAFEHDAEGPDDMPAHVRSALTATSIVLPIRDGRLDLGTWQGVYLYEHRRAPHERRVSVTVLGEGDG
ncbi:MAG: YjbQ family protein [Planctomycetes bacterium]|nr:YjbQ family protein [Planctomycetota bacterium]